MTLRTCIFLDRDGVLNRTTVVSGVPHPPASVRDVEVLPGVRDALAALAEVGHLLVVVTNQPDVARGTQSRAEVERINAALCGQLPQIDAVYVCYHDNADRCECRKPAPGMLLRAAREHGIDLQQSWMVGDRWSDVEAGRRASCRTCLIDLPHSQAERCCPDERAADLSEAARLILLVPSPLYSGERVRVRGRA